MDGDRFVDGERDGVGSAEYRDADGDGFTDEDFDFELGDSRTDPFPPDVPIWE